MRSISLLVFSVVIFQYSLGDFPSYIQKCRVGDIICISKVITDIFRNNPTGNSDMGLPRLEPLYINNLAISDSNGLNLKLNFKDVNISGISKITVDRVVGFTADPETSKFELCTSVSELRLKSKYTADGRILVLPIQGKGDADLILEGVRISVKFQPTIDNRMEKKHLGVKKIKVLVEPSRLRIKLENLFNGDKILGDNMHTFLNENWKDIWVEVSPTVNMALAEVINNILISVFEKSTYDEFYLKD